MSQPHPGRLVVALIVGAACAACTIPGGTPTPVPAASGTASPSPTGSPSSTPTAATASVPVASVPVGMPVSSASPLAPVLTVPAGTQRALTIADAFAAGSWVEGAFQPVGATQPIEALALAVGCSGSLAPLEFRFAQTQGALVLGVAQAADSSSSGEKLSWSVVTDGRLTQSVRVGFRDAADIAIPLAGVSVVQVELANAGPCGGTATALVTKAVVNG